MTKFSKVYTFVYNRLFVITTLLSDLLQTWMTVSPQRKQELVRLEILKKSFGRKLIFPHNFVNFVKCLDYLKTKI